MLTGVPRRAGSVVYATTYTANPRSGSKGPSRSAALPGVCPASIYPLVGVSTGLATSA